MNHDDPNDFDLIANQIAEDWPSPDEIDSLVSQHGRKKDFTYEQSGSKSAEETNANVGRVLQPNAGNCEGS